MKRSYIIFSLSAGIFFSSCHKSAGTGGTSMITGTVKGTKVASVGQAENMDVLCTSGASLEHGDYWLLNSGNANFYYYVYYVNPTWISDADPHLQGRIGIPVTFNYSDSNVDIAQKTQLALSGIVAAPFTVTRTQDILHILYQTNIPVTDADNGTTSFSIDVLSQGKPDGQGYTQMAGDHEVFIVYGTNTFYSDMVLTDETGSFAFEGLQNGDYRIYVLGNDPQHPNAMLKTEKTASITEKNSKTALGEFSIFF